MDVQVLKLARKLGQAFQPTERADYFRIKYECRCLCVSVCVCMCLCACRTPSPKIASIISSSTYCKNLLDGGATMIGATKPRTVRKFRELSQTSENCLKIPRTI